MAANIRYLTKRGEMYRYERWIPEGLQAALGGRRQFRLSLRTKDQSEACLRAVDAERRYEALITSVTNDGVHREAQVLAPTRMVRAVTDDDLAAIEHRQRISVSASWTRDYLRADADVNAAAWLDDRVRRLELFASERREAITTAGFEDAGRPDLPSPTADARRMIDVLGLDAAPGSEAFGAIVAAIRRGYLAGDHDVDELLAGRAKPRLSSSAAVQTIAAPTIGEAIAAYLLLKKLPAKTTSEVNLALRTFSEVVGDRRLDEITRADFRRYVEHLAAQTVGGKSVGSIRRPMSADSVKKRLGLLRTAINHAIETEQFTGPNPASGFKMDAFVARADKSVMPAKRPLTVGELNRLFTHPWFTGCQSASWTHAAGTHRLKGAEYWAPIVALFTGCRASELGGLRVAEVRLDDPHPHIVIRDNEHRRTKGGYSRNVPILDALITHGFGEYVDRMRGRGEDRLFPDWKSPKSTGQFAADDAAWSNAKIIRAFNRTVIPAMLRDQLVSGARREVTFHSLRGAFKSMLGSSRFGLHPNTINEVVGHAKQELDRRYVGTIPIEETYPAIRGCSFAGLQLPMAP